MEVQAEAEQVSIIRPSGRPLFGTLLRTADAAGVVVMLHGLLSHRDHNFAPRLSVEIATKTRLAVYRFDFRATADTREPDYRFRFCAFEEDCDDVAVVVRHLEEDLGLPVRALCGHSRGANVAIMAAAKWKNGNVPIVVAIAPRFDMAGMLSKFDPAQVASLRDGLLDSFEWLTTTITREDVQYVSTLRMEMFLKALPHGLPLLLVHGDADVVIPVTDAHALTAFRNASEGTELHVIQGGKHTLERTKHVQELLRLVTEFLLKHIPEAGRPGMLS